MKCGDYALDLTEHPVTHQMRTSSIVRFTAIRNQSRVMQSVANDRTDKYLILSAIVHLD
jgi:hypothetical protein